MPFRVLQGNEYFQRKSYLTALREYSVSVLSAPSADESFNDNTCQPSSNDSGCVDDGKAASDAAPSVVTETDKMVGDGAENKQPDAAAKDESSDSVEQKPTGDGVQEGKGSNKNELALAYANRLISHFIEAFMLSCQNCRIQKWFVLLLPNLW